MARNEERNIEEAIASLKFASQIVVADTGSSDRTMEFAKRAGAEVHSICFDGYGESKNRAIEFARHDWIFCMDADERVTPGLAAEIMKAVRADSPFDGYEVSRLSYFLGKPVKHSGWFPDYVLRLFKRDRGSYTSRLVHEAVKVNGKTSRLEGLLLHHSYRDLDSYMEKLNVYSTLNARELYNDGRRCGIASMLAHPLATFLKMYVFRAGFLDGYRGMLLAGLSAFHVFIKYAKLRDLSERGKSG